MLWELNSQQNIRCSAAAGLLVMAASLQTIQLLPSIFTFVLQNKSDMNRLKDNCSKITDDDSGQFKQPLLPGRTYSLFMTVVCMNGDCMLLLPIGNRQPQSKGMKYYMSSESTFFQRG